MAAEGKIDPMHQFTVEPLVPLHIGGYDVSFTNSSLWLLIALAIIIGFMAMGMKRELVPGRWQMAVEGLTGFIDDMVKVNIGPEGKKYRALHLLAVHLHSGRELSRPGAAGDHPGAPYVHDHQPFQHHRPCSRS